MCLRITICAFVWFLNGICIIQGIRKHRISEVYMHAGLGIFFSLLTLELTVGRQGIWAHFDLFWIAVIGWFLYIPSALLVFGSIIELHRKGRPKGPDFTATTTLIRSGLYGYLRQPMTLGMAIWSAALVLVFQSGPAMVLGILSLFCFWMSARKENEYDIRKFGDDYKEYMEKIPMWNILRRLKR